MNDVKAQIDKRPLRAARLVWLVVMLGLGTSLFTLCMVWVALAGVREQRNALSTVRDAADSVTDQIGRDYAEVQDQMQRQLALSSSAGASSHWQNRAAKTLDKFAATTNTPSTAPGIARMRAFVEGLGQLDGRCQAWGREFRECQAGVEEQKKQAETALVELRAALGSAEGRERLELAKKVRKFRKLEGNLADDLARQIIAGLEPEGDVSELSIELSALAMFCERLVAEEEIDHLADLKDNAFSASLFRVGPLIGRVGAVDPGLRQEMQARLADFTLALMGAGYVADAEHQTVRPGAGGLYSRCRQRLELRKQRQALRAEMAHQTELYREADDELDATANALNVRIAADAEASLTKGWRTLLLICASCGASLLFLGNRISVTIRLQIAAVAAATADLSRSNAQMAAIHLASLDGVLVLDHAWRIVEFNPAAQRKFRRDDRATIGRPLSDLVAPCPGRRDDFTAPPPRDSGDAAPHAPNSLLGTRIEAIGKRFDGSTFPLEISLNKADIAGGHSFYVAAIRDISEPKRAEVEREQLHSLLLAASRQAGMAEVATGVLHNVGNALNSVNVSASVVAERLRHSEIDGLQKAGEMLKENADDLPRYLSSDARGQHLPAFLIEVARCIGEERDSMLRELEGVERGLEHIKHIVTAQQAHAKRSVVLQPVRPAELAEAALEMQKESFARHQIVVERTIDDLPPMPLDKHKILQVLVNLISNAKNALREGANSDRVLTLSVDAARHEGRQTVRFRVADNGMGIAPEHLTRIFSHGFTTRNEGHGFGLHSAAIAAREMGGNLSVASEGIGRGATFTLEIPIDPAASAAAAPGAARHSHAENGGQ